MSAETLELRINAISGIFGRTAPSGTASALLRLQRGLTGDRRLAGAGYMDDPDALSAYFSYYWPVSYLQVSMALLEIRDRHAGFKAGRVLDLGSGPGPATAAVRDFSIGAGDGCPACTLADRSAAALDLAGKALSAIAPRAGADPAPRFASLDLRDPDRLAVLATEARPDLVVACHSLNELWKDEGDAPQRRAALIAALWKALEPGAVLLVLEPASLATARPLLALRDTLLASLADAEILAPCTTARPCPALAAGPERTCHSEWPWTPPRSVAELAERAGLDRRSVKAAWFALRKSRSPGRLTHAQAHAPSPATARVVSEPMLNKAGRLRYVLCSDSGLTACSARKDDQEAVRAGFFSLVRGDRFTPEGFEPRGDAGGIGFAPGARLGTLARIPVAGGGRGAGMKRHDAGLPS